MSDFFTAISEDLADVGSTLTIYKVRTSAKNYGEIYHEITRGMLSRIPISSLVRGMPSSVGIRHPDNDGGDWYFLLQSKNYQEVLLVKCRWSINMRPQNVQFWTVRTLFTSNEVADEVKSLFDQPFGQNVAWQKAA